MTTTTIIGITSALVKSRKYKLILVGAQFAYLGYKLLQKRKKEQQKSNF
jgi:hypothetical protein